jgi:membrane protease YdiL (CAAX protease family)
VVSPRTFAAGERRVTSDPPEDDSEPRTPGERRPISFLAGAGWTFAVSLTLGIVVELCEELRPGATGDLVTFSAAYVLTHLVALFVLLRVYEPEGSIREVVGLRKTSVVACLLALPLGAGAYPTMNALDEMVARRFPITEDESALLTKLVTTGTPSRSAFLAVSLAFALPLVEDVFFRGFLFGGLKKGRTLLSAVMGTAIFYALAQGDPRSIGSALALGLTLSWLRAQTGSLIPAMLAHVAYAAIPVIHLLRSQDPLHDAYARPLLIGGAALTLACAAAVHFLAAKDPRALQNRLADG